MHTRADGASRLALASLAATLLACGSPEKNPTPPRPQGCPSFADLSLGLPTTPGWRTNPSLADVDGDGFLDLAATNRKGEGPRVYLFRPPDRWIDSSAGIHLDAYPCGIGVELTDLSGDGLLDLLVADHCTGLYMFRGDGKGGWERMARLVHPSKGGFNDAAAGDLDGDGRVDLVGLASFIHGLSVYTQTASGSFTRQETDLPRSGQGYEVHLGDLDGDGDLDIYTTLSALDRHDRAAGIREAKVWIQGDGHLWEPARGLPETGNFYGIALGDIDEDGAADLALSSMEHEGGIHLFYGSGGGTWHAASAARPGQAPGRQFAGVALSDLDLDGHLDLVAIERRKPALVVWLGDGTGRFTECPEPTEPLPPSYRPGWGLAVGDINNDGYPDIVAGFGSEGGGALRAWSLESIQP